MMFGKPAGALGMALALIPASLAAQPAPTSTLPVLSVAGSAGAAANAGLPDAEKPAQTLHQETSSVSVVDRAEIEQFSPASTLDILRDVPGISVSRSGGIGGQIYMRGFSSNDFRSSMYIDGDRFHGRNTLQLSYLDPEELARVEVIRGPGSVLYGSEAMTGLVNFITLRPSGNVFAPTFRYTGGSASLTYGSAADAVRGGLAIEGAGAGFDFRGSVAARYGGDYSSPLGTVPNSDYKTFGGSLILGYTPKLGERFEVLGRAETVTNGRAGGVGGVPGAPLLVAREQPNQVYMGRLGYVRDLDTGWFSRIEANTYVNYFYTKLTTVNRTVARQVTSTNSYVIGPTVWGGKVMGTMPWRNATTNLGVDFSYEERSGSEQSSQVARYNANGTLASITTRPRFQTGPDANQTNAGAFVLHEWTPVEQVTVSAGGRLDWFNTQTATTPLSSPALLPAYLRSAETNNYAATGSVGLVYRPLSHLDLVANVGNSFRQPTTSEMFSSGVSGAGYTVPNPGLKPERGVTYEGGFRLHFANASAGVTAYHNTYKDLIVTAPVTYLGTASTQRQNVSEARIDGIEIQGNVMVLPAVSLFGNATALRGTNTATNKPLPYISPFHGRLGVEYAPAGQGYTVTGTVDMASAKTRIDSTQEFPTSGYGVFNLYATLELDRLVSPQLGNTRLILGAENIFDKAYRDASTYGSVAYAESLTNPLVEPGRNFTATLRVKF